MHTCRAYFWTATEYDATYAWRHDLGTNYDGVPRFYDFKDNRLSVRCLEDY